MSVIKITVDEQNLHITDSPKIAAQGVNENQVEFTFSEDWAGFGKTAIFYTESDPETIYTSLVDEAGLASIPHEITASEGRISLGLSGVKDNVVKTSEILTYKVVKGLYVAESSDPSPGIYEQMLTIAGNMESMYTELLSAQENLETSTAASIAEIRTETAADIDEIDARMDEFLASQSGTSNGTLITETSLFSASTPTKTDITISDDINNYDYIDIRYAVFGRTKISRFLPSDIATGAHWSEFEHVIPIDIDTGGTDLNPRSVLRKVGFSLIRVSETSLSLDLRVWRWDGQNTTNGVNAEEIGSSWSVGIYSITGVTYEAAGSSKDAELTDIRVGADGTTYETAGAAVRGQYNDLMHGLNSIIISGKNLLNPNKTEIGYMSAADGRITEDSSYFTSDFIPIANGQSVTISPKCRKFLAFDGTRTAIQSTYINNGTSEPYTYTATENGFIRISYLVTDSNIEQIEYGNTVTEYETFRYVFASGIDFNDNQKDYIDNEIDTKFAIVETKIDTIEDSFIVEKYDVVAKTEVVSTNDNSGYYNQNGAYGTSTSYFYSDLIPVLKGDLVYAERVSGITNPLRYVTSYTNEQTIASGKGWANETTSLDPFIVPDGVAYVRVTLYVSRNTTQNVFVRTVNGHTEYYAKTLYKNILDGKKWVACGDSFTQGDFSGLQATAFQYQDGKYVGKNKVYPYVIGLRTNADIVNEAISGSTIAYVDGSHNEFSTPNGRYTQIPNDADYITLYFGINDSHHNVPIGTIDDNTNTTFYGAWNTVMQYLITNHPNAKIGIIVSNGCDTIDYPNAEIAIAKKYGVSYLDFNSDYKVPILFRVNGKPDTDETVIAANYQYYRVSSTNGHPNVAMHEYESTIIQHWLESM